MTLRGGKAIVKHVVRATASVNGAAGAMTIKPKESLQVSTDLLGMESESYNDEEETVTIEWVKEHITALDSLFHLKTSSKADLFLQNSKKKNGGTDADKRQYDDVCTELGRLRDQMLEWRSMLEDMEEMEGLVMEMNLKTGTALSQVPVSTTTLIHEDESEDDDGSEIELSISPDFPTPPSVSDPVETNVREFLYEFKRMGVLKYDKFFEKICYRLLSLTNLDEKTGDAFFIAHEEDPDGIWDWSRCEQAFVDSALTFSDKTDEVDEFAKKAVRERTESYKAYSRRLRRLIDVYNVHELPKYAYIAHTLRMTIPSQTLMLMEAVQIQKMIMKHIGMSMPDTTSLDFLVESISNMKSPDESTEWKTKKSRATNETEKAKMAQQAKEKLRNYQKAAAAQAAAHSIANAVGVASSIATDEEDEVVPTHEADTVE
ncbi:hypothetical protein BGZ99_009261 [Dissophora globulifera]|uniref:Uncharacterized protein n=1 Tax=Dissophora globulifera TaxID=979702 RepID=A0A9P6UNS1_9FUNG|nr:hypothetical protein BGZ99_009261 [Dissophora globulifera]